MINPVKKIYWWMTSGIILVILLLLTNAGYAQPASTVILRVVPDDAQVQVGGTLDMAVEVANIEDLYGIDILLEFDPQVLEVVDMIPEQPGVQIKLGTFLEPGFVILNLVNNDIGRLRLAMTQLGPTPPKSGTGNLIVVRFRGKTAVADSAVTIEAVTLAGPTGNQIEIAELESGRVAVVETLPPGPTNTPIPAVPPGTPMPTSTPFSTATPEPGATQDPDGPAPTATDRFLFIPPTFTPSNTPTQTATPTETHTPSATVILAEEDGDAAAPGVEGEPYPVEDAERTPVGAYPAPEGQEDASGVSAWWFIIPGALIAAGAALYFLLRRRTPKLEEF